MHPATRLARVLQQLRTFATLHSSELDEIISQLESKDHADLAARLRTYRDLHPQELALVLEELADVRAVLTS